MIQILILIQHLIHYLGLTEAATVDQALAHVLLLILILILIQERAQVGATVAAYARVSTGIKPEVEGILHIRWTWTRTWRIEGTPRVLVPGRVRLYGYCGYNPAIRPTMYSSPCSTPRFQKIEILCPQPRDRNR
jgi:hypothetical protein